MLPRICHMSTAISRRACFILVVCAGGLLTLPTFHGSAQSQEVDSPTLQKLPKLENKVATHPDSTTPAAKKSTGAGPAATVRGGSNPEATKRTTPVGPPSIEYLPKPTAEYQRIVKTLDERTTFEFEDVLLKDAMKILAEQHKINIVLGIDSKAAAYIRISLKVSEISLRNALKLMLQVPLLSYVVADEVLKIVPQETLSQLTETRIYPVQDLVGELEDFESLIQAIQQSVARGTWSGGQPGGPFGVMGFGGGFGGGGGPSPYTGGISKVPASGSLVIHHNVQVHDEILQLLRGLREAKSIPPAE